MSTKLTTTAPEDILIAKSGIIRELADLSRALEILRSSFSERFKVDIPDCTIRYLSELELRKDFEKTNDPLRRYTLVAFADTGEIAFNPHAGFVDRLKFLAHELGHCTLLSNGFEPDSYRRDGSMGPKRVYHEEVAEFFGRNGEEILRNNRFLGGPISSFLAKIDLFAMLDRLGEGDVIGQLMKAGSITMQDILTRPEEILAKYPDKFRSRRY